MRVTVKGQVTIPRNVRESLGIKPETEIDFIEDDGKFYIIKTDGTAITGELKKFRGIATAKMSTDEIMHLTREL
ncbi:MAG: AbrB/MazE/SpoVT family DNA-binding domain-containing protein [Pseudomonadota bacterium]|nr:AbrB/MazE/SpoVT family DNA-binding domain-containing protein [Pseudomonadota bacterium]